MAGDLYPRERFFEEISTTDVVKVCVCRYYTYQV